MKEDITSLLEKQNFVTMLQYMALGEIEEANGTGKKALERLSDKYSDEIRRVNNAALLYKSILRHQVKLQRFNPAISK